MKAHIRCVICQESKLVEDVTSEDRQDLENYFICGLCEEQGWWFDPAGGLHRPDEEPEDYVVQYE